MMDLSYQQPQPYPLYENPQWAEDLKPAFADNDHESNREPHGSSEPVSPSGFSALPHSRRPSNLKVEADYAANEAMWHDRSHEPQYPSRHFTHPSISVHNPHAQHPSYMRIDPNFAASYAQPQPWPLSPSGTNTPTPGYGSVDSYGQPVQYAQHPPFNFNQDPISAVSMSPQSSHDGGWTSAASTDSAEQQCLLQSPIYRPVSPQLVLRPDGIRKKNARFEIPKERNLQTIDALIMASTDDNEKKELKQQKRLLRNRQAALDSRQRKKSHTEKLEQEKKVHEKRMIDLEELCASLQDTLQREREQQMHQRQQYEIKIQQVMHDRDEAIRAKTIEAADYRRQMNAMRDYIREHQLDRQPHRVNAYGAASDMNNIATDMSEFNFEDDWDTEFNSLIVNEDMRMEEFDSMQRQATPKPPPTATSLSNEKKPEVDFSWGTFYMCLLFGAVVVSAGGQMSKLTNDTTDLSSSLPKISDEYRADAENVLKAVMASDAQSAQDMIPQRTASVSRSNIQGAELSQMSAGTKQPQSNLDKLSSTLTTPSRHQHLQQAFSLTPSSYNHIMDPLGELDNNSGSDYPGSPRPSRIDQAYAAYQAKEQASGFKTKAETRSVLSELKEFWEQAKAGEK